MFAAAAFAGDSEIDLAKAIARANQGAALRVRGQYREAAPLLERAVADLRAAGASGNLSRALGNLAALHLATGDVSRAEAAAREAVALAGDADRDEQQLILAGVLVAANQTGEAQSLLEPLSHRAVDRVAATALTSLTAIAIRAGETEEAYTYGRRAVEHARLAYGAGQVGLAAALNNFAQACRFSERFFEAERHYREAISIWQTAFGSGHPDVGRGLMNLAALYHDRGREAGAEALYGRAAAIFEAALGSRHPQTLAARNELADVYRAQRRYAEADRLSRSTVAALEQTAGAGPRLERALLNRARLLEETRRGPEAAAMLQRAQSLR